MSNLYAMTQPNADWEYCILVGKKPIMFFQTLERALEYSRPAVAVWRIANRLPAIYVKNMTSGEKIRLRS